MFSLLRLGDYGYRETCISSPLGLDLEFGLVFKFPRVSVEEGLWLTLVDWSAVIVSSVRIGGVLDITMLKNMHSCERTFQMTVDSKWLLVLVCKTWADLAIANRL